MFWIYRIFFNCYWICHKSVVYLRAKSEWGDLAKLCNKTFSLSYCWRPLLLKRLCKNKSTSSWSCCTRYLLSILCTCLAVLTPRDSPLVVICLCSPDTRRVAAIRGRQYHQYNARRRAHVWHLIYLKHPLRLVNYPTKSPAVDGWVESRPQGSLKKGAGGLTLTSGPRSCNKFRPAAQIGLVFPRKTPHPSAKFLLIKVSPRCPEARPFSDACGLTLIPATTPIHI